MQQRSPERIDKVKIWMEIIQAVATVLAIAGGLIWFVLQRSTKPEVKIEQTVTHRSVAGHPDQSLISVDVRATNVGKVKVDLEPGVLEILQINPILEKDKQTAWPKFQLKRLTLEPGESDQALFRDFIVPATVQTIQIHSRYTVPGEPGLYWNLLSFADIGVEPSRNETASSVH
ncbi:hypothetical protein [Edaphobacter sp. DSM 109919]|uniref:DUF4352 domain-containing protein n=1 Tax=Edaphobacter paludis TaxID=3035702 RepID=A0AAU7CUX4_9BACT